MSRDFHVHFSDLIPCLKRSLLMTGRGEVFGMTRISLGVVLSSKSYVTKTDKKCDRTTSALKICYLGRIIVSVNNNKYYIYPDETD